jgi:hypothetical protein
MEKEPVHVWLVRHGKIEQHMTISVFDDMFAAYIHVCDLMMSSALESPTAHKMLTNTQIYSEAERVNYRNHYASLLTEIIELKAQMSLRKMESETKLAETFDRVSLLHSNIVFTYETMVLHWVEKKEINKIVKEDA